MRWLPILSLALSLLAADHAASSGKIRKSNDNAITIILQNYKYTNKYGLSGIRLRIEALLAMTNLITLEEIFGNSYKRLYTHTFSLSVFAQYNIILLLFQLVMCRRAREIPTI
jgi:hypothetical protein